MSLVMKFAGAVMIALLAGCGGGTSAPATPVKPPEKVVTSFPLRAGYQNRVKDGFGATYMVTGDCGGFVFKGQLRGLSAVTFDGTLAAQMAKGYTQLAYTGSNPICIPANWTFENYYNSDFSLVGHSLKLATPPATLTPVEYGVLTPAADLLPVSVKVDDTAVFGIETIYSDSSKTLPAIGYDFMSYVIETDAPSTSTAVVNLITERYDTRAKDHLIFRQQARSRIVEDGTLTDMSIDLVSIDPVSGASHLVFTTP